MAYMLVGCISWLNFLGEAFQAWEGLHLYGRWGLVFFLAMCKFQKIISAMWVLENYFGFVVMMLWIFRYGCMSILELVLKFRRKLLVFFLDFSVGCLNIVCLYPPSVLSRFGAWWLIIWPLMMWVLSSFSFLNLWHLVMIRSLLSLSSFLWFFRWT